VPTPLAPPLHLHPVCPSIRPPGFRVAAPGDDNDDRRDNSSRSSTVPQQQSSHNNQVLLQRRRGSTHQCPTRHVPTTHADLPSRMGRRRVRDKTAALQKHKVHRTFTVPPPSHRISPLQPPRRAQAAQTPCLTQQCRRRALTPSQYSLEKRLPKAKHTCADSRWWCNPFQLGLQGRSPQADPSDRKTLTGVVAIRPGNLRFSNFLSCGPALRSTGQDNYNIQMLATSSGPIVSAGNMGHATCARNACCSPRMRESTTPCVTMRSLRGRSVLTLQCGRRLTFRVILLAFGRIRRRNGRAPPGG
jgi:hypothetical protein